MKIIAIILATSLLAVKAVGAPLNLDGLSGVAIDKRSDGICVPSSTLVGNGLSVVLSACRAGGTGQVRTELDGGVFTFSNAFGAAGSGLALITFMPSATLEVSFPVINASETGSSLFYGDAPDNMREIDLPVGVSSYTIDVWTDTLYIEVNNPLSGSVVTFGPVFRPTDTVISSIGESSTLALIGGCILLVGLYRYMRR